MNVYDFDKTIYPADSTVAFCIWCYRRHPSLIRFLPGQAYAFLQHYVFRRIDKTTMKTRFFVFFRALHDPDAEANAFWRTHACKIESWYLEQKRADDLIISASPTFLLRPVCEKLGVRLIASEVDSRTGVFRSPNCHDTEKPRRFYEQFPDGIAERFYSDSISDSPMASVAGESFLVSRGKRMPWPEDCLKNR